MKNTTEEKNLRALIAPVADIAREAAEEILKIYATDFAVRHKDDKSPLTAADMAAHKTISARLAALTPDIPVLSEESSNIPFATRTQWRQYWLIDPLDGTREFIKRNGEFTVNIALIEGHRPSLGVVHIPVSGTCYFAAEGTGAFKQEAEVEPGKITSRKTRDDHFTVAGSRSHGGEAQQQFFSSLGENIDIIAIGSSLKLCLVAEGKVDIYPRFGPTCEWDIAAAHCIIEQAGGIVTDTNLKPLEYNKTASLLNPHFLAIADPSFNWKSYLEKSE